MCVCVCVRARLHGMALNPRQPLALCRYGHTATRCGRRGDMLFVFGGMQVGPGSPCLLRPYACSPAGPSANVAPHQPRPCLLVDFRSAHPPCPLPTLLFPLPHSHVPPFPFPLKFLRAPLPPPTPNPHPHPLHPVQSGGYCGEIEEPAVLRPVAGGQREGDDKPQERCDLRKASCCSCVGVM